MKFKIKNEENEKDGVRYFNLKIRANSISPCTILYDYKQKNSVFWAGKELQKSDIYWFNLGENIPKIGDRLEIVTTHKTLGEVMKVSTLEVIDLKGENKDKGIRVMEISRWDSREEDGPKLETKCKVCPTCKREL